MQKSKQWIVGIIIHHYSPIKTKNLNFIKVRLSANHC